MLDSKTKAIPISNNTAFTSIITFYECNKTILWLLLRYIEVKNYRDRTLRGKSKLNEYIKHRPDEKAITEYMNYCIEYWDAIVEKIPGMLEYVSSDIATASELRNRDGGNILFRPAALIR